MQFDKSRYRICLMASPIVIPYLHWHFHMLIEERSFEGLTLGKAEVHRDGTICCTFSVSRNSTRADVRRVLQEECVAWADEHASGGHLAAER